MKPRIFGNGNRLSTMPAWFECTNGLCKSRDYIATQPVRRGFAENGEVKSEIVGQLNQCCKCGELYYATVDGCYRAPNQFQVREPKIPPDWRPPQIPGDREVEPLPEP